MLIEWAAPAILAAELLLVLIRYVRRGVLTAGQGDERRCGGLVAMGGCKR